MALFFWTFVTSFPVISLNGSKDRVRLNGPEIDNANQTLKPSLPQSQISANKKAPSEGEGLFVR